MMVFILCRYVNLDVATPATLKLGRVRAESEAVEAVQELGVISLVEGEEVRLGCEATGAWPRVTFLWSLPGLESVEAEERELEAGEREARAVSSVLYTARSGDQGAVVRCSGVQESPGGQVLYKVTTNLSLEVTMPQPLLASRSGQIMGVITGGLLALVLVISILGVTLAIWKKKKRLGGSVDRGTSNKISASEATRKDVEKIWVTQTSSLQTHPHCHRNSSDSALQTSVEVHNSSSSSNTSSSSSGSRASSHEVLSPQKNKKEEDNKRTSEAGQGEYISYSPAYMYSSYEVRIINRIF